MTKKILCLMLCAALILPTCIIPASGLPNTQGYTIENGVLIAEDFETAPAYASTNASVITEVETSGNHYQTITPTITTPTGIAVSYKSPALDLSNSVVTMDLRADVDSAPFFVFNRPSNANHALGVGIVGVADGNWYTYRIEIGDYTSEGNTYLLYNSDLVKVWRKPCGEDDDAYVQLTGKMDGGSLTVAWSPALGRDCYVVTQGAGGAAYPFGFGFRLDKSSNNADAADGSYLADYKAKWSIDNFAVIKQNTVTAKPAEFVEEDGNITPVFSVSSGCTETAVAITAVYDADDNKVSIEKADVNINAGLSKVSAPAVSAGDVPAGGRVEAMLWNSDAAMQPIAPVSVYGTPVSVDTSDAPNFTYSAKANEITVEGAIAGAEEITLKAVDEASNLIYATQFETSDGSFKKVLPITYTGNTVTVSVSALGETAESSSAISMLNNWAAFKTAFENLDKDSADEFFGAYADNFRVNENGTTTDLLDGVALDAATMSNIGYLKSIKTYDADITYSEIVDAVVTLATEDVAEVNTFMSDFADAKALSTTDMAQAVEDMKALLQNATFLTFDRTSDIICATLLSSDATDIEEFWTDYVAAKDVQATEEATQIPGLFAGIQDAAAMADFFNETITISGLDYSIKETIGLADRIADYTDKDYAVMYGAYSIVIGETDTTDYAAVGTAIEFLLDYTEEYKVWTAEIATKTTASDEWASIKKVFGTDLDYVTPALADTYFENETKAYKRITDLGYQSLAAAAADITTANAKIACLASLDSATTATEIKTQVELAKNNGWVAISATISDAEYERMVGFGFNYFSDILVAYDFAIGPDYQEYSIRDGKGDSEIRLTDFVAQGYLTTEDGGDYLRFTPDGITRYNPNVTSWMSVVRNTSTNVVDLASPNTIITADIRYITKGMPFMINFAKPAAYTDAANATRGMSVALVPRELNKWYTYKFEIGAYSADTMVNDYVSVFVKEKDADDSAYVLLDGLDVAAGNNLAWNDPTNPNNMDNFGYIYNLSFTGAKQVDIGYHTFKMQHASWTEDVYNQTVTDMGVVMNVSERTYIAKSAEFKNQQGAVVTELPETGTVTPSYVVKNTGKECWVDSVVAIYDKNGVMVALECEKKTVASGEGAEISGPTVDVSLVPNGGRIEALLVDKTDRMRPLSNMLALGTLPVIGETDCAETTFSTKANTITVEGTLNQKNENVVVTVKDLSDTILSTTQFKTVRQGYFKNTVIVDPALDMDDTKVKVLVSTASGVVEEEVDMSLKWNAMKTALSSAITESFFETYANCLEYYEPFATADEKLVAKKTVISFADASEKTLMTALVNTFAEAGTFDEMTSQEILDKLALIKKNIDEGKVDVFVAELTSASDAEEVIELLTSDATKDFVMFDVTDVSNIDAVVGSLGLISTDGMTEILEKFEAAKAAQQYTENLAVGSEFKAISDATTGLNSMKSFFENDSYKAILGITDVTYTADDAEIMYSVFVKKNYDKLELSVHEAVAGAIKFVQDYVNEFNTWTTEINNSQTATAEWSAIEEVFGELSFVTPELVDTNKVAVNPAVLSKVYDRLDDLGYTDLGDAATKLGDDSAVIAEKLACIDEIDLQANRQNGASIGYWAKVQEQAVLAANKGWITLDGNQATNSEEFYKQMLAKSYNYLEDIKTAYDAAVLASGGAGGGGSLGGGGGAGGAGGSGGGAGGGGNASKEDADSIIINQGTSAAGSGININGEGHPSAPFLDVTAEYNWAEPSITGLRKYGIILGDGDGNFRPGASISREEFLSILLKVFKIENKETTVSFSDVKKNEWYYNAVATAYELGIVKGYTDGRFGIGDNISRADMAVMVCRVFDMMGKAPAVEEVGYIFTDYAEIPDYAYNAVSRLQQMGLVKGDDLRNFYPTNSLTRAESAVVLWPIYQQSGSMIQ